MATTSTQITHRIEKGRREYNQWVATETLEDYALRYSPREFRKWSEFLLVNTSLGSISFLALEAIGATIAINYGFTNAFWAILFSAVIIFLTGLPITYYAARYNIDIDLLTRSAGFGYVGSTVTSLIYPEDGVDITTLLKNADAAMYCAKEKGRNNYQFFNSDINARVFNDMLLENALHQAVRGRQLVLHYQPQYDLPHLKNSWV